MSNRKGFNSLRVLTLPTHWYSMEDHLWREKEYRICMIDRRDILAAMLKFNSKRYRSLLNDIKADEPSFQYWEYPENNKNFTKFLFMVFCNLCRNKCYPLPSSWGNHQTYSVKSSSRNHRRKWLPLPHKLYLWLCLEHSPVFQELCKSFVLPQLFLRVALLLLPFIKAFKALEQGCQRTIYARRQNK